MKNFIGIALAVLVGVFGAGYALQKTSDDNNLGFSASQYRIFNGVSTNGETLVGTTDTTVVEADGSRTYLRVCKTAASTTDTRQVTLRVGTSSVASISDGSGFLLDSRVPCIEFVDATLVSGLIEGVASPSAASVSFTSW